MFNASGSGIMMKKGDKKNHKHHKTSSKENGKPGLMSKYMNSPSSDNQANHRLPILKINLKKQKTEFIERKTHLQKSVKPEAAAIQRPAKKQEEFVKRYVQEEVALANEVVYCGIADSVKTKRRRCRDGNQYDVTIIPSPVKMLSPRKRKKKIIKTTGQKKIKVETTPTMPMWVPDLETVPNHIYDFVTDVAFPNEVYDFVNNFVYDLETTPTPAVCVPALEATLPNNLTDFSNGKLFVYNELEYVPHTYASSTQHFFEGLKVSIPISDKVSEVPNEYDIRSIRSYYLAAFCHKKGFFDIVTEVGAMEEVSVHCEDPKTINERKSEEIHSIVLDWNEEVQDLESQSRLRHFSGDSNSSRDSGFGSKPQSPNTDESGSKPVHVCHSYAKQAIAIRQSASKKALTSLISKNYDSLKYLTHLPTNKIQSSKRGQCSDTQNTAWVKAHYKALNERRVIYLGNIPSSYTKEHVTEMFKRFGKIEDIQLKSKQNEDNAPEIKSLTAQTSKGSTWKSNQRGNEVSRYGFITYQEIAVAREVVTKGNELCTWPGGSIGFGGRREFVKEEYADFDSEINNSICGRSYQQNHDTEDDYSLLLKREQEKRGLISN